MLIEYLKRYTTESETMAPRVLQNESSCHSTPVLSHVPSPRADPIPEESCTRTNSTSAGMVKLRNFSSRSDVNNHSRERRTAFTRISLCYLDTYVSRFIVRA